MQRRQRNSVREASLPMESPSAASAMLYISLSMILIASFLVLGTIHPVTPERAAQTKQSVAAVFRQEKIAPLVWPFSLFTAEEKKAPESANVPPPARLAVRVDAKSFELVLPKEPIINARGELTAAGVRTAERLQPFLRQHPAQYSLRVGLPFAPEEAAESMRAALRAADSLSVFFTDVAVRASVTKECDRNVAPTGEGKTTSDGGCDIPVALFLEMRQ